MTFDWLIFAGILVVVATLGAVPAYLMAGALWL